MVKLRLLLTTLLLVGTQLAQKLPLAGPWTTAQREWALGTSALLSQMNEDRFDRLAGADNAADVAPRDHDFLVRIWGISSPEQLIQKIDSLLADNADRTRIGWNYPRAVNLARWGYAVGFLREEEAWAIIMPAAQHLQQTFASWQEMGQAYLDARRMWYSNRPEARREAEYAYRVVVLNPESPWRKYPWNLDLGGNKNIQMIVEKTAWVTIAPHQEGLICVQLGVPDHTDDADHTDGLYVTAIAKAVGCKPRITGSRHARQDWVIDTECEVKDAVRGTQLVANLRIEEIAKRLRSEGITQLFFYIQHEPNDPTELVPAADDSFVQDGLQWYVEMRSLRTPISDATLKYVVHDKVVPQIAANESHICSVDESGDKESEIGAAAMSYVKKFLGDDPGAAFDVMSKQGQEGTTRDQIVQLAPIIRRYTPQNVHLQHLYMVKPAPRSSRVENTGALGVLPEVPERVVCGNDPTKPDGWVSLKIINVPAQAHVDLSADAPNNQLSLTVWLVEEQGVWRVLSFSFHVATLADKGAIELWENARDQSLRGHKLNSVLLYGAAAELADRGPNFQLGIQPKILQDMSRFVKPPEIQGLPPYLWENNNVTWKVLNVGLIAISGRIYVLVSHEVAHWQNDDQVNGWNKALLTYFKTRFPEYSEEFAGLVVSAYERGTNRGYRTVDENSPN
jgi:hypothetical protein